MNALEALEFGVCDTYKISLTYCMLLSWCVMCRCQRGRLLEQR